MEEGLRDLVRKGYDVIAEEYLTVFGRDERRAEYVDQFISLLPAAPRRVLDVGCGAGSTAQRLVAAQLSVTGIDLSSKQIEIARTTEPRADFMVADMTQLDSLFQPESFDGVCAFYSIIHLERDLHLTVFRQIYGLLKPGGVFVASLGHNDLKYGQTDDWLGAPMFWSHFDSDSTQQLLRQAGFVIESAETHVNIELQVEIAFLWVVARRHV